MILWGFNDSGELKEEHLLSHYSTVAGSLKRACTGGFVQ